MREASQIERAQWDRFVLLAGLHDASWLDEFSCFPDSLQFSWSCASHGSISLARLYILYVG